MNEPTRRRVTLIRTETSDSGTFGMIDIGMDFIHHTCELPWRDNGRNVSCIPDGTYRCEMVTRPDGRRAYEVKDVPGRSAILFHSGNTIRDIRGCILLGRKRGRVSNARGDALPAVLESKAAVADLVAEFGGEPFELVIEWSAGVSPEADAAQHKHH